MILRFAIVAFCVMAAAIPTLAAEPDWPCMQRKVPELGLKQVWNGPDLAPEARGWTSDPQISALVQELGSRRLPVEEANVRLKAFAAGLPQTSLRPKLDMIVQGLFERLNGERSQVMAGLARYARRQLDMAARLRKASSELGEQRNNSAVDVFELDRKTQALAFETRMFQERAQSLRYACEVPAQFEQRLYALLQTIAGVMKEK
jgi:hypothetical protein